MFRRTLTAIAIGLLTSAALYYVWASFQWRHAAMDRTNTTVTSGDPSTDPPANQDGLSRFHHDGILSVDARLEYAAMVKGLSSSSHIMLTVKADPTATAARAPANIVLVLDRSGSMAGARMGHAIAAAQFLVSQLADGDRVAVVSYSGDTRVEVPSTVVASHNRDSIARTIASITVGGGTCISCGLEQGRAELTVGRSPNSVNRIVLLSDGQANQGVRHVEGLQQMAHDLEGIGGTVSSIGVGLDYNEELMSLLAVAGNGNHYFVENTQALAETMRDEIHALGRIVAQQVNATFALAPGVHFVQGYERAFSVDGSLVTVALGDLGPGEEVTALFEVSAAPGSTEIASVVDLSVGYRDVIRHSETRVAGHLSVATTNDTGYAMASVDPDVRGRIERAAVNRSIALASKQLRDGDTAAARQTLNDGKARVQEGLVKFGGRGGFAEQEVLLDGVSDMFEEAASSGAPASMERAVKGAAVERRTLSR